MSDREWTDYKFSGPLVLSEMSYLLSSSYSPFELSPDGRTRVWRPADTTEPQFTVQEPLPITPEAFRDLVVAWLKFSGNYREATEAFETPPKRSRRAARRRLKKGKRR